MRGYNLIELLRLFKEVFQAQFKYLNLYQTFNATQRLNIFVYTHGSMK